VAVLPFATRAACAGVVAAAGGVLFDQAQSTKRLDSSVHKALFEGWVPDGLQVWMFKTEPPSWELPLVWSSVKHWTLPSTQATMEAQTVTFGVMHLVVQVLIPTAGSTPGVGLHRRGGEAFVRQLWPDPLTPFIWPPPATIAWNDALKLPDTFDV
jgi:hypothetical protein